MWFLDILILALMFGILLFPFAVWLVILFVFVPQLDSIVISMYLEENEQSVILLLLFPYIENTKHSIYFKMTYFYLFKKRR